MEQIKIDSENFAKQVDNIQNIIENNGYDAWMKKI